MPVHLVTLDSVLQSLALTVRSTQDPGFTDLEFLQSTKRPLVFHLGFAKGTMSVEMESSPSVLEYLVEKRASVSHDLVFALRALSPKTLGLVQVDYKKDIADLYREATVKILSAWSDRGTGRSHLEDTLNYASAEAKGHNFQSWVPDWNSKLGENLKPFVVGLGKGRGATESSVPSYTFSDDFHRLIPKGRSSGFVTSFLSDTFPDCQGVWKTSTSEGSTAREDDLNGRFSLLRQWLRNCNNAKTSPDFLKQLENLLSSAPWFSQEVTELGISSWMHRGLSREDAESILSPNADASTFGQLYTSHTLARNFAELTSNRRLFITTDGRIGLCRAVQVGDLLVLFSGCCMPFVLRAINGNNGYTLIGPAIVTGVMNGQLWPDDESALEGFALV
jgi:hypothetical protein